MERGGVMVVGWVVEVVFDVWFCAIIGSYANEGLELLFKTNHRDEKHQNIQKIAKTAA